MDPRKALPYLIVTASGTVVAFWYFDGQTSYDLSLFLNMAVASFTALLAAFIALWIYSHLTRENQLWEFRQDRETEYFEQIYGPLYEETSNVVEKLKAFGHPWMSEWPKIRGKRFGPFVDQGVASAVEKLDRELTELGEVSRQGWPFIRRLLDEYAQRQTHDENLARIISEGLRRDDRFLFDPDVREPNEEVVDHLERNLKDKMRLVEALGTSILYQGAKDLLSSEPAVIERVAKTRAILPLAESVHQKVLQRMRDPFRQVSPRR